MVPVAQVLAFVPLKTVPIDILIFQWQCPLHRKSGRASSLPIVFSPLIRKRHPEIPVSAGVLQTESSRRFCQDLRIMAVRCQPGLSRQREGPDDCSGHAGRVLCPTGAQGEEQGLQERSIHSSDAAVHDGR